MNETIWSPPSDADFAAARQTHMELYGSVSVHNTYLRIAVFALSAVSALLAYSNIKIVDHYRNFRPIVIRVHDTGKPDVAQYAAVEFQPQAAEMKYFLIQFVQLHYGRVRATLKEDFAKSLFFLDGNQADAVMDAEKKTKLIESFLTDRSNEIDIRVTGVCLEDVRKAPYRAKVEYEKVHYSYPDHREVKRTKYTGNFVFTFRTDVSNDMIPVNPLGFTITYFREDEGF